MAPIVWELTGSSNRYIGPSLEVKGQTRHFVLIIPIQKEQTGQTGQTGSNTDTDWEKGCNTGQTGQTGSNTDTNWEGGCYTGQTGWEYLMSKSETCLWLT